MTDNKLKDNEIIKALECCLDIFPLTCKNCPLFNVKNSKMVCSKSATKFAIDLINRQQAENINLKGHLEQLKSRYDNAKSEIKRLKGISVSPSKDPMDFCGVLCDYAEELIDKAKSEAYKEFAERLKEKKQEVFTAVNDSSYAVTVYNIDNLVKEMAGE